MEDILSTYFKEINKYPLLSDDEVIELAKKIKAGDEKSRAKLITSNLRFVASVAKKYQGRGLPLEDLISEGNAGLIQAVERFDYTKGFKFSTYGVWWIRHGIIEAILNKSKLVRFPYNLNFEIYDLNKSRNELLEKGEIPTVEKISKKTGYAKEKIKFLLEEIPTDFVSLTGYCPDTGKRYEDVLESDAKIDADLMTTALRKSINKVLKIVRKKEKDIIKKRFGLNGGKEYTLEEIGKEYHLTRERIRQLEETALEHLRGSDYVKKQLMCYWE